MHRYLRGLLDPSISLLEAHKLMYFMQEAGEPLRLHYVAGPYGPYADNLRHVFQAVEGYYVSGYADGGDLPDKPLDLVPGAVPDAEAVLRSHTATRARFNRVAELVEGFETAFGLELLSTVHWIAKREHINGDDELVRRVHGWSDRKRRFTPLQIRRAKEVLAEKGWYSAADSPTA
jgi:hypothetical protein